MSPIEPGRGARALRRTQRTIAVVRLTFCLAVAAALGFMLVQGDHNDDSYTVPDAEWDLRLWHVLAVALAVIGLFAVGAVADLARTTRKHGKI